MSGYLSDYDWTAFRDTSHIIWLQYGCEKQTLDYWRCHLQELCNKHKEPEHIKILLNLFNYVETSLPLVLDENNSSRI